MPASLIIRILLADDHILVRDGIKALLSQQPLFDIVGEARDGLEAVEMVTKLRPDVLVLDLRIQRLHGLEVLNQLRTQERTRTLVLSMYSDEGSILAAWRNNADGYVTKDSAATELIQGIKVVAAGGQYICESLRSKALAASLKRFAPGSAGEPHLSKREFAVFELAAEGKSSAEIASELSISRRTAEAHRASIMKKLGLKNQTELVLHAIRVGILTP